MTHKYDTRSKHSSYKSYCVFSCCGNRTLTHSRTGNQLTKLKCADCGASWHDMCLFEEYEIILSEAYASNNRTEWICPTCFEEDDKPVKPALKRHRRDDRDDRDDDRSDDSVVILSDFSESDFDIIHSRKSHKNKHNKSRKKPTKTKTKKTESRSYESSSSSDAFNSVDAHKVEKKRDKKNKKLTKKLIQKKQAILNRLKSIDSKYGLKYNTKMLDVSDSATDVEFDYANYYPDKAPKSEKSLENLRVKKAKEKGGEYAATKKSDTKYRKFEKDAIIDIIEDLGKNPEKYDYTQRYGWCRTDVSVIVRDYLYDLRKAEPAKYQEIPYRNCASITSKFIWWEAPANKESTEKDYISKYMTAKNKINLHAVKGTTSANDTLTQFGKQRTEDKLKKAQKKIKTLTADNDIKHSISGAVNSLVGMISEIKNDNKKENEQKIESQQKSGLAYSENNIENPYVNTPLMEGLTDYSPANNRRFMQRHDVHFDDSTTSQQTTQAHDHELNMDKCIKFITKLNNKIKGPFDEVNEKIKSDVYCCERILWDDHKCNKLARKYGALTDPYLQLSDTEILKQLAVTAKLLL